MISNYFAITVKFQNFFLDKLFAEKFQFKLIFDSNNFIYIMT